METSLAVFEPGGTNGYGMRSSTHYENDEEAATEIFTESPNETTLSDTAVPYDDVHNTVVEIPETLEERDDTVSNYSSDVPLLEPSKDPEEPLDEKVMLAKDEVFHMGPNENYDTQQLQSSDNDIEGAYINASAETGVIPGDCLSLSSEFESNSGPVSPRNHKKLNVTAEIGRNDIVSHQTLNLDYVDFIDVQEVSGTPIHVIGPCWEFGSLSSVHNSNRESFAFRSRTNTLDQQSYAGSKRDVFGGSNRLLARVFSNAIGSIELSKKDKKEMSLTFLPNSESLSDQTFYDKKRSWYNVTNKNSKNLIVLSVGVTLLFISMFGLTNLQSSLNSEGGLGVYSLAMSFVAFLLGSLVSTVIVKRYRPKLCLIMACLSPLLYVLVHFHPTFAFFLPASFILGLSKAILWNAVSTYIAEIGIDESNTRNKRADNVISKYYGIFFLTLQLAFVFGNLISSLILVPQPIRTEETLVHLNKTNDTAGVDAVYSVPLTLTNTDHYTVDINTTSICGSGYCNSDDTSGSQPVIDDLRKTILLGIYALCVILSTVIMVLFLDHLPNYTASYPSLRDVAYQTKSMFVTLFDRKFLLILVLCMYTIICNGFVVADVLKAFVTCPLGIHMVGYTMICFGLTGAASSYVSGKLIKHVGRVAIYITAMVLNVVSLIWMITWEPTVEDTNQVFTLLGLWGLAEGIWQSQINSLISSVFADRYEEAFGCCRLVQGVAGIIVFSLSENLCMMTKIIFTMTTCILGVTMYIVMEVMLKLCPENKETHELTITVN